MRIEFVQKVRTRLPKDIIKRDIRRAAARMGGRQSRPLRLRGLTVCAVGREESRRLNRRYLGKSRPANVLSFRYDGEGEVVIAPELIRREAKAGSRSFTAHLRRMVIHGFMHIAGMHHEGSSRDERRFEQIEQRLLEHLGID